MNIFEKSLAPWALDTVLFEDGEEGYKVREKNLEAMFATPLSKEQWDKIVQKGYNRATAQVCYHPDVTVEWLEELYSNKKVPLFGVTERINKTRQYLRKHIVAAVIQKTVDELKKTSNASPKSPSWLLWMASKNRLEPSLQKEAMLAVLGCRDTNSKQIKSIVKKTNDDDLLLLAKHHPNTTNLILHEIAKTLTKLPHLSKDATLSEIMSQAQNSKEN